MTRFRLKGDKTVSKRYALAHGRWIIRSGC